MISPTSLWKLERVIISNGFCQKKKRRHVVYLRKSTDDEIKQIRSLEDREVECRALARQMGVVIREDDILKKVKTMAFQRTKIKKGKNAGSWMTSYYCRNKDCIRHNHQKAIELYGHKISKSIRLKYLTAHIKWTLRHLTKNTVKVHNLYIDQLKQQVAVDKNITKRKLAGTRADIQ